MNNKKPSHFNSVEDTLYIPLLGRIYVSRRYPDFFYDEQSLKLEPLIPKHSMQINDTEYYYLASATRYFLLDNEVRAFIKKYPNGNIVNLGAGLDTSAYRIDTKTAHFYELDLPDVIAMRQQILPETDKDTCIASSFLDTQWINDIDSRLPTLFVASGLFHYFKEAAIQSFLRDSFNKIPQLAIVFDAVDKAGLKISNRYVKKMGNHNAEMYFYVNSAKHFFNGVSPELNNVQEYPFYTEARKRLGNRISLRSRFIMWASDKLNRVKIVKGGNIHYDYPH
ncbi:MAG: conjugal transfer protein [Proteobacteria bacterium]|nr:MAG: conjugal transfer protein [Pseudomonadota bacterium]